MLGQASRGAEDNPSCAVLCNEGVWEYFSCVQEEFVVDVVRFGERGVK